MYWKVTGKLGKETRGVHACGGRKDKDLNSEETASKINCPQNPLFHLEVNIYEEKTARHTEISWGKNLSRKNSILNCSKSTSGNRLTSH